MTCGVTFTFGGLRITDDGQVMDLDYRPIPGLYAAGELVGGIFYFNYPGGTGLTSGSVFGRIAGTAAGKRREGLMTDTPPQRAFRLRHRARRRARHIHAPKTWCAPALIASRNATGR